MRAVSSLCLLAAPMALRAQQTDRHDLAEHEPEARSSPPSASRRPLRTVGEHTYMFYPQRLRKVRAA